MPKTARRLSMTCPKCDASATWVIDSRPNKTMIRRRRKCGDCSHRWTTFEVAAGNAEIALRVGSLAAKEEGQDLPHSYHLLVSEARHLTMEQCRFLIPLVRDLASAAAMLRSMAA